jgi:hypothetical protein
MPGCHDNSELVIDQIESDLQAYHDQDKGYVFMIGYLNALIDYNIIDQLQYELLGKFASIICEE